MRAAYIDMTNENNTCPQGLNYTVAFSTRMCSRSHTGWISCSSLTFPTHGVPYTKVCGRARGYQFRATPGFYNQFHNQGQILDSAYVSGLSVTYGSPRSHIRTFAVRHPRTTAMAAATAPVPLPTLIQVHLHLWEKTFSASLGTLDHLKPCSGTLMTLCGTHRGVQQIAPAVIVVVHGSLPH